MELRSSASTAGANNVPEKPHVARKVAQYVEGESSDETEEGAELDNEDDGSVEDVVLGGSDDDLSGDEGLDQSGEETGDSEDDSEDDSDLEEPDSDDEDSDASGPLQNGFIDDEAEEWSEEEDEEDSD
jgi:U3 small nucleolar RNA-associated protein 5